MVGSIITCVIVNSTIMILLSHASFGINSTPVEVVSLPSRQLVFIYLLLQSPSLLIVIDFIDCNLYIKTITTKKHCPQN